ncbi:MAG: RNA-binding domain-containing protein, partial [Chlamydiia bacterium]
MFPFGPVSSRVEYRERLPQKEQLLKTICAFANQFGGLLVIGVSDQGDVLGLQEAEAVEMERSLDQYIVEHVYPPILPTIRTQWVEGKLTLVIEVGPGSQKPYYLRSKGMMEGTFLRFGASTHRAPPELISEMQWQGRGRTWDLVPLHHATQEDLNHTQIEEFFTRLGVVGSSEDLLRSYEILVPEQGHWKPSIGGILLFGHNPEAWAPEAGLLCSIFGSNSVKEGPIASKEIRGSLFVQLQEGLSFLKSNLTTFHTMEGIQRQDRLEVPLSVLREALVNALIHRNYAIPASTKLAIFDDRIEIFSPGGFPGIMTPTGLEPGISYIRNRLLARAFRESGLAEKLGTGLYRMREHCV